MELYKRKAVIIAINEAVYGTDENPTGANAIGVSDLKIEPAKGTKKKRALLTPDLSTQKHIITQQHQAVSFTVELKGAGAAGSVPECGPLLRACMMSETISAGVSVAYQLVSESFESATIYVNQDGVLHKLLGCRGSAKFNFNAGDYPTITFSFLALAVAPADAAPVTPTYTTAEPLEVNAANTTFSFGGYAAVLHKLDLDIGVAVKYRELVNQSAQIAVTGRDCKGSLSLDAVKVTTKDFWADWRNATQIPLTITHGLLAGEIVEAGSPKTQLDSLDYGDADGILTYNAPISLTRDAGDDELVITFK